MEKYQFRNRVYCRACRNETYHSILFKHTIDEEIDEGRFYMSEDYMIGECMGCKTVTFIKEYDDSTMHFMQYNAENGTHELIEYDDIKIYPPKPLTDKVSPYKVKDFQHLPELLETLYKQVVANFELKYYLLAAAGLRMIIEGICNDLSIKKGYVIDDDTGQISLDDKGKQVKNGSLNGRINGLVEKGILTERQTVILHIIRKVGNQTVHGLNNPPRKIILDSLEIIEQTFRNIYELEKYDSLKKKYLK